MKRCLIIMTLALWPFLGLFSQERGIRVVKYEGMVETVADKREKLTIVNFWATWCVPCIEELPHFIEVFRAHKKTANLDIVFVSLDRATDGAHVQDFAKKHRMPGEILLLDDVRRFNEWIPKVHPDWEGTLPATGFYRNGQLLEFRANALSKEELINIINKLNKT